MDKLYENEGLSSEELYCGSILKAFLSERRRSPWYRDLLDMEERLGISESGDLELKMPGIRDTVRAFMHIMEKPSESLSDEEAGDILTALFVLFDKNETDNDRLSEAYHPIKERLAASIEELTDFRISHPGVFAELSPMGLFCQVKELLSCFDKARGMRDICSRIIEGNIVTVLNPNEREELLAIYIESSAIYDTLITRYQHLFREDTDLPERPAASLKDIMKLAPDYTSTSYDYARIDAEIDCREKLERRLECIEES